MIPTEGVISLEREGGAISERWGANFKRREGSALTSTGMVRRRFIEADMYLPQRRAQRAVSRRGRLLGGRRKKKNLQQDTRPHEALT